MTPGGCETQTLVQLKILIKRNKQIDKVQRHTLKFKQNHYLYIYLNFHNFSIIGGDSV